MPSKYVWRALSDVAFLNESRYRCLRLIPFHVTKSRSDVPSILVIPHVEFRL